MIHAQNTKVLAITLPADHVDDAAFTTEPIDTKGFDYANIYVMLGATDIGVATLQVEESDTFASGGTGFAAISELVYGTATNIDGDTSAKPSATDDGKIFGFDIDLRGRKRYLDLDFTAGDGTSGTFAVAWAELSRAEDGPTIAAERGCEEILRV